VNIAAGRWEASSAAIPTIRGTSYRHLCNVCDAWLRHQTRVRRPSGGLRVAVWVKSTERRALHWKRNCVVIRLILVLLIRLAFDCKTSSITADICSVPLSAVLPGGNLECYNLVLNWTSQMNCSRNWSAWPLREDPLTFFDTF
jgi:hypothetical protein